MVGLLHVAHAVAIGGYRGPPNLTLVSALTSWRVDPGVIVFALLVWFGYSRGISAVRAQGLAWPRSRSVCVAVGLASLLIATTSFVGAYAHVLFWVYSLQIVLLLMVIPLFFALSMPVVLVLQAIRPDRAARLSRILAGWPARLLAFPVTSSILMVVVPFAVYFTGIYEASLRHYAIYELVHLLLLGTGCLFFWSVIGGADVPRRVPFAAALFIAFVELIVDALPGIVVRYTTRILASGYYHGVGRPWGPSLRRDQGFGGAVLWFVGEAVGVPVLAVLLARWIAEDRRDAVRIDRDLADVDRDAEYSRPWWESDASLFGDRARRNGWGADDSGPT